jgi:hypothetical protein
LAHDACLQKSIFHACFIQYREGHFCQKAQHGWILDTIRNDPCDLPQAPEAAFLDQTLKR